MCFHSLSYSLFYTAKIIFKMLFQFLIVVIKVEFGKDLFLCTPVNHKATSLMTTTQLGITCSNLATKTLEQGVKYVQS